MKKEDLKMSKEELLDNLRLTENGKLKRAAVLGEGGVPMPEYTLHPEDIMIKFSALQNAKIPKRQNGGLDDVLEMLRKMPCYQCRTCGTAQYTFKKRST